jgi:hypothetical protein
MSGLFRNLTGKSQQQPVAPTSTGNMPFQGPSFAWASAVSAAPKIEMYSK